MALQQTHRLLNLHTPLGENELVLTSFRGREELSRLFTFRLELISDNNAIQPRDLIGQKVALGVRIADESFRYFHGYVSRFSSGDEDHRGRRAYSAEVVPWLWFLTQTTDCRIFQNQSVPEILRAIFTDLGFHDFDDSRIRGSHPKHEYRVQYRESDFQFISRLAEEEGIFYYFLHEQEKHTLVLADQAGGYYTCEESHVDYPTDIGSQVLVDHITRWDRTAEFHSGRVAHTDYNFLFPRSSLLNQERTVSELPGLDRYEQFDYPGRFTENPAGKTLARIRMEELEASQDIVRGASTCRTFSPGGRFTLGEHKCPSEAGTSWNLVSVDHAADETMGYETGSNSAAGYRNAFSCIPAATLFRPGQRTLKPVVRGPQTAVVVGPPGETIYPDAYGRVKVQFFWDRQGQRNENSSCWMRVSQNWAGQGWGGMFIPHIGQEVLVDFLEGDPDRPIITGRVYNAEQTVPLELPANKTKCVLRDQGQNQMVWNGQEGAQYMHLQQECGNELLMNGMPGKESVQLRDKHGSELFLDAASGTVRLSTPSHNSAIILGNSIYQQCDSSNSSYTKGDTLNVHRGVKHDVYRGFRTQTDIGGYYEAMLGWKSVVVIGSTCEAHVGNSVTVQYAKEVAINAKDYVQHSKGAMKIDSDQAIGLVGGAGDASKAILDQNFLSLAYKKSAASPRPELGPAEIAALILGFGGHAAVAVKGIQMDQMKKQLEEKIQRARTAGRGSNKPQEEIDREVTQIAKEWTNTTLSNWSGELSAAMGAIAGIVATKLSSNPSLVDEHQGAQGELRLFEGGALLQALNRTQRVALHEPGVLVQSENAGVDILAKQAIRLETKSAVVSIKGEATEFGKTKIRQKNLVVD